MSDLTDLPGRAVRYEDGTTKPISNARAHREVFGDTPAEPIDDDERERRAAWRRLARLTRPDPSL